MIDRLLSKHEPEKPNDFMPKPTFCSRLFQCQWLASGEVDHDQDPFKYSHSEYHEVGHDFRLNRKTKHGKVLCKFIDEVAALVLVVCPLIWTASSVLFAFGRFVDYMWHEKLNSMALVMFANNIIEFVLVFGASGMWYTMCYWDNKAHAFWKLKVWPLPSLMPGGFMPRLAAFSLGVLMFTTSTLVSEGRVAGNALGKKFHNDKWQYCRATDMSAEHAPWYGRILTRPPVVTEGYHCFKAHFQQLHGFSTGMVKVEPFDSTAVAPYLNADLALNDTTHSAGLEYPRNGGESMQASPGFPMDLLVSWNIVGNTYFHNWKFQCMYQCSKWKTVGLMAVIKNAGTIVAGSAVVVKTSDMISKRFGGLPLITADTKPLDIKKVVMKTTALPNKGRSKTFAAFVCLAATLPLRFSSKIDSNGYYTVDYYVTAVFFSSLVMALVLRQWNPYKMMRIAYTENLWLNGSDMFIDREQHIHRKIDLYEWIHLDQNSRAEHLLWYARKLTVDDIDDEMKSQKFFKKMDTNIPKTQKKLDSLPGNTEDERAEKADEKDTLQRMQVMLKEAEDKMQKNIKDGDNTDALLMKYRTTKEHPYSNKYANLVVKTIDEIKVVTNSPPVDEEFSNATQFPAGITISQILTLEKNAIGTVRANIDGGHIKVRFPKKCPDDAPTHDKKSNQYGIEHQPKLQEGHLSDFKNFLSKCADFVISVDKPEKQDEEQAGSCPPEYEDVVVKLEQVIEANQEWVDIQDDWERQKTEKESLTKG